MRRPSRIWTALLLAAMLSGSAVPLTSCARRVTVIPADRMVRPLPNGNYEVSPAWLQERYRFEMELKRDLEECKGGK